MGTRSSSEHSAGRVKKSLANSVFVLFAGLVIASGLLTVSAQIAGDESRYASVFSNGTSEEKRTALFEIRNAKSPELSRIAVAALRDADDIVRATAAFSVIALPTEEAERSLLPNLTDRAEIVRRETAYALGRIRAPRSATALIAQIEKEKKHSEAKAAMIVALGEIGDVSAVDFLARILSSTPADKTAFERRSAARSIGRIAEYAQFGGESLSTPESFLAEKLKTVPNLKYRNLSSDSAAFRSAVRTLVAVVLNPKETADTRREAAFALGAIGDDSAVPVLNRLITDPDYYLVEISREALRKITPQN